MFPRFFPPALTCVSVLFGINATRAVELTITTSHRDFGEVIPARIHLAGPDGQPVRAAGNLPFWSDHISSPGNAVFTVAPGKYSMTVERGPEWSSESAAVEIAPGQTSTNVQVVLKRLANLSSEGWWAGEMHIHRPIDQVELLMRAEDLHFGQLISWWNTANPWANGPLPSPVLKRFDGNRFVDQLGGEDERDGGALLFFNLDHPINITAGQRHHPSSLVYAKQAKADGAWIDIEKPFWWDVPMWIANGIGDSIGIANNHMYRTGVYPNEAWGRPRNVAQFPGARGNGWWTQEIYYHLLNAGIRIPASAGAASGVLPNPVGYNRVYVQFDGEPTMGKWRAGLKAGRVFVSNGPLLRVKADGQLPGHVFKSETGLIELTLDGQLDSRDPIERVEFVRNGYVEQIKLPAKVKLTDSGWFLVRAITTLTNTLRFASTGPFYVELQGGRQSPRQRESSEFFVGWCDERLVMLRTNAQLSAEQKSRVVKPWLEARAFWWTKADAGRADGSQARPPRNARDAAFWLNDMVDHSFTHDEMRQVTGFNEAKLELELVQLPSREPPQSGAIRMMPYPGGRHPRLGFLEGAISPQRETKISVFTPWDPSSYVVIDVPEALWSNLGLTYLAHTHIDTVWDKQGIRLPQLEWVRHADGLLTHERTLPNGIAFGAAVKLGKESVEMELWLKNGTAQKLSDLRVQNCVMLKGAAGFGAQTNDNTRPDNPFAIARSEDGRHWIITAWERCHHPWANPPVPCIHSDPKFPDLAPGETGRLKGWLWFYEGVALDGRLQELKVFLADSEARDGGR
ncbi:MAG: hypothetical protein EXS36_03840 [Pedosphaera sp.]|nr:hypothetical protein [Pedosphaera sp.]